MCLLRFSLLHGHYQEGEGEVEDGWKLAGNFADRAV